LLPSINTQVGAGLSFGNSRDYTTQAMTTNNTFSNQYQITASLMLFDGLSSINRLKMARVNTAKSRNQFQNIKDMLSYEVVEAYLNVAYFDETISLAQKQVATSIANQKKLERMEELGMVSIVEITEAKAKLAEDKYFLTQQENLKKIAVILLKEKLNYPLDKDLYIKGVNGLYTVNITLESASDIFAEAIQYLPQALIAQNSVDAEKMAFRSAKGSWYPRISMNLGSSTNYFKYLNKTVESDSKWSYSDQLKDNRGEFIQFNFSFPIFTGFSRTTNLRRAKANFAIARYEQENTFSKIYRDIEQTIADVNGQVDDYHQALEQEEAMLAAHQANVKKHQEGLIDPIQLSISANRLLQAQVASMKSYHTYVLKLKLYQYYKGIPYTEQN
ncbi:TolC family protein, partial [Bacteroides coprosuis]|uniref:TolC family protein n=1 Tax=Bacteroides coprosuis TaxID=151276 RepID=UPI001E12D7C0